MTEQTMSELHVFEIDTGVSDFIVAENEQEAVELYVKWAGISAKDYPDGFDCSELRDEIEFTMDDVNGDGHPVTKTCAEWAAEKGKGFLASTEF